MKNQIWDRGKSLLLDMYNFPSFSILNHFTVVFFLMTHFFLSTDRNVGLEIPRSMTHTLKCFSKHIQ